MPPAHEVKFIYFDLLITKIGDRPPIYLDKSRLGADKPFDLHHKVALAIEEFLTLRDVIK